MWPKPKEFQVVIMLMAVLTLWIILVALIIPYVPLVINVPMDKLPHVEQDLLLMKLVKRFVPPANLVPLPMILPKLHAKVAWAENIPALQVLLFVQIAPLDSIHIPHPPLHLRLHLYLRVLFVSPVVIPMFLAYHLVCCVIQDTGVAVVLHSVLRVDWVNIHPLPMQPHVYLVQLVIINPSIMVVAPRVWNVQQVRIPHHHLLLLVLNVPKENILRLQHLPSVVRVQRGPRRHWIQDLQIVQFVHLRIFAPLDHLFFPLG